MVFRLAKSDHAAIAHGPGRRRVDDPDPCVPRAVQHLPGDSRPGRRHARHDAGAAGPAREFAEPGVQRPARGYGQDPAEDSGRARRRARGLEDRPADRRQGRPGSRRDRSPGPAPRIGGKEPRQDGHDRGTGPPRAPQAQGRGVRNVDLAEGARRGTVPRPGGHRSATTS